MSIDSFLLTRFGYLKVAPVVTIPGTSPPPLSTSRQLIKSTGLPFHQAIPQHIYTGQRQSGSVTDKDHGVLFRPSARGAWLYTLVGLGVGLAARPFARQGSTSRALARTLMYAAPSAGLLAPAVIETRTHYLLDDPQRVAAVFSRMRVESVRWWIDVRREVPREWAGVVRRVGAERGRGEQMGGRLVRDPEAGGWGAGTSGSMEE